jgi:hypothetical protein
MSIFRLRWKPRKIPLILGFITIIFFVYLAKKKSKEDCIRVREQYLNAEYNGVVSNKFKGKENHAAKTLIIKGKTEKKFFRKYRDISGLYEYVRVGDSIYKPNGSLDVKVIRGKRDTIFSIDLECDGL